MILRSDPTGAVWSYVYDARGLMTSATSPVGGVTAFAYDPEGNLVEQTDPNGARWRWEYDMLGRCTLEVDPLGHEVRYAWTERGDLTAVFRGEGSTMRYVYDGERRMTEIQEAGQRTTGLSWGGYGRLVQKTDPAGGMVLSRYNREGELTEVHNELGEVHRLRRDGAGLVIGEETFDGRRLAYRRLAYRRDHAGRVVRAEVAGEITEYAYDPSGALVSRTRPDDAVESFAHDMLGELVRATWPGGELRFERDEVGASSGKCRSSRARSTPSPASTIPRARGYAASRRAGTSSTSSVRRWANERAPSSTRYTTSSTRWIRSAARRWSRSRAEGASSTTMIRSVACGAGGPRRQERCDRCASRIPNGSAALRPASRDA